MQRFDQIVARETTKKVRYKERQKTTVLRCKVHETQLRCSQKQVRTLLNTWWSQKSIPTGEAAAQVVSIFKKGDPNLLSNYRPIALLRVTYKLLALLKHYSLLQI